MRPDIIQQRSLAIGVDKEGTVNRIAETQLVSIKAFRSQHADAFFDAPLIILKHVHQHASLVTCFVPERAAFSDRQSQFQNDPAFAYLGLASEHDAAAVREEPINQELERRDVLAHQIASSLAGMTATAGHWQRLLV